MPLWKLSLIFNNSDQEAGWSEVQYIEATTVQDAEGKARSIASVRSQVMEASNSITFARISQANRPAPPPGTRRQRAADLIPIGLQGSAGSSATGGDLAFVAAKIRLEDATGMVFRIQLLRGLPDSFWENNSDKLAKTVLTPWAKLYAKTLVANSANILHFDRTTQALVPVPIAFAFYEALGRRATGRPFGLARGRR